MKYLWERLAFTGVFSIISKYFASKTVLIPLSKTNNIDLLT